MDDRLRPFYYCQGYGYYTVQAALPITGGQSQLLREKWADLLPIWLNVKFLRNLIKLICVQGISVPILCVLIY